MVRRNGSLLLLGMLVVSDVGAGDHWQVEIDCRPLENTGSELERVAILSRRSASYGILRTVGTGGTPRSEWRIPVEPAVEVSVGSDGASGSEWLRYGESPAQLSVRRQTENAVSSASLEQVGSGFFTAEGQVPLSLSCVSTADSASSEKGSVRTHRLDDGSEFFACRRDSDCPPRHWCEPERKVCLYVPGGP